MYVDEGAEDALLSCGGLRELVRAFGALTCSRLRDAREGDLDASAFFRGLYPSKACFLLTQPLHENTARSVLAAASALHADGFSGEISILTSISEDAHGPGFEGVYTTVAQWLAHSLNTPHTHMGGSGGAKTTTVSNPLASSAKLPLQPEHADTSAASSLNEGNYDGWGDFDGWDDSFESADDASESGATASPSSKRRNVHVNDMEYSTSRTNEHEHEQSISVCVDFIPLLACALGDDSFILSTQPALSDSAPSESGDVHAMAGIACALGARRIECFGLGEDGAELSRHLASITPPMPPPSNDQAALVNVSMLVIGRPADFATPCSPTDSALAELMQMSLSGRNTAPAKVSCGMLDDIATSQADFPAEQLRDVLFDGSDSGSSYRQVLCSEKMHDSARMVLSWLNDEQHDKNAISEEIRKVQSATYGY